MDNLRHTPRQAALSRRQAVGGRAVGHRSQRTCLEERQCLFDVTCGINEESSGGVWENWLIRGIAGESPQIA